MFTIRKEMEVSASHHLELPYESPCSRDHGHNYKIILECKCADGALTEYGMVIDFTQLKKAIHDRLDHQNLNEVMEGINPTAENMCWWIRDEVNKLMDNGECYHVSVQETTGNIAEWRKDN